MYGARVSVIRGILAALQMEAIGCYVGKTQTDEDEGSGCNVKRILGAEPGRLPRSFSNYLESLRFVVGQSRAQCTLQRH